MCGIVAVVSDRERVAARLDRAVRSLAHRGPDHQQCWVRPDGRMGLGHARLSIIDPETGNQPIANESGDVRITAAGEFYDFERIRDELVRDGHRFSTGSDTEIALHLYEQHGVECLAKLDGEFAFVIWDERRQTLFAARDRFGIKPLYYTYPGGTLWIGSEIKALFAAGVRPEWDASTVFSHLFFALDSERTLFRDIRQVPPAHFLLQTPKGVTIARYWDVNYRTASVGVHPSDAEYAASFGPLLEEAVRLRLRADVPVGCYLSGGLDSSYVLALARKHARRPLTAFTVSFAEGGYDEGAAAREVAARLDVALHEIPVRAADVGDHFSDAVWHGEGIHYNLHGVVRYLLSEGVGQQGCKAVLAGEGADECFAGYAFCQGALREHRHGTMPARVRQWLSLLRRDTPSERSVRNISPWLARVARLRGFPPGWTQTIADQITLLGSVLAPDFLEAHSRTDPFGDCFGRIASRKQLSSRARIHQVLYLWIRSVFANYILSAERMDMAHAVEVRLPFLDAHVFDFARQLPASALAGGTGEKHLLRLAARPLVGDEVARRPKQPFYVPFSGFGTGSALFSMAQDALRSDVVADVPFLERNRTIRLADTLATGNGRLRSQTQADAVVIMIMSLCILQDRYGL